ncbi:MAG: hypothetical protein HYX53_03410 [Chloroflexi bacterium]|nr:hypothetical protein [Chloroflexota bacterium]
MWRHAITDSELLLEEEGLSAAVSAQLDDIRSRSRTILGLVPQMLADDGTVGGGARSLGDDARELQAAAAALRVSGHGLPPSDLGLIVPATSSNLRAG